MKIKNIALSLVLSAVVAVWLWQMTTLAATDKDISMDLTRAIQHMVNVKIISGNNSAVLKYTGKGVFWIQTKNFVISQTWANLNSISNAVDVEGSSILWWIKNSIGGGYSSILWWESNINSGNFSAILWWKLNNISNSSKNSSIVGWNSNVLNWESSVIVGWSSNILNWNYSVVLWNNAGLTWNGSVALWSNSKINNADNSFLWTDGSSTDALTWSNVFVVMAENGMVVNTGSASDSAKLTIWWPLVINGSANDVVLCDANHKWVIKVVDGDNNHKCFCSCDWVDYWHSLYGQWRCEWICNGEKEKKPDCGTKVTVSSTTPKVFLWECNVWEAVTWEWAYSVDKDGIVHWMCQTDAGLVANCTGYVS